MNRVLVFALAVVVVGSACSQDGATPQSSGASTSIQTQAPVTSEPPSTTSTIAEAEYSEGELKEFLEGFAELPKQWNENSLVWLTAYSDPNVSYEEFVSVQYEVALAQGGLVTEFDYWAQSLPEDLRIATEPTLEHYRERYQVLIEDVYPAAIGDDDAAFQAAGEKYTSLTSIETLEPMFREFFATPALAEAFEREGSDPEAALAAFLRTFGG